MILFKNNIENVLLDMSNEEILYVLKRDNQLQEINYDKILQRLTKISKKFNLSVRCGEICMKIMEQTHDKIPSEKIDELCAEQAASLSTIHYDYNKLASSICISNHQKKTPNNLLKVINVLYNFKDLNNQHCPIVSKYIYDIVINNSDELENIIDYNKDYLIDYFGFKTLERAYLLKVNDKIIERPQHMWMRVALQIHGDDIVNVKKTYELMSTLKYTHATPTLFNSGTLRPQLSSCYLLEMKDDSIDGIYDTLKECAQISKWAGGIGLHIHNVRGKGSLIRGTNGTSNGIIPMLRVFNSTARYVDQGGGKRNGSFAIYLEPWHTDIEEFLEARKNHGDEEMKARDLFYALWIPDYFMKCVHEDVEWYLFCPDRTPGLSDVVGDNFVELYTTLVNKNSYTKKIKARQLWFKILDSQMETGTPYLLYKDSANLKSNQKNLGIIKSSNLCCEIIEYSSSTETAVCNLASIALSKFVNSDKTFNYDELHSVTKQVTINLNKLIDVNYYPSEKTKRSNLLHRPIGIGVQGLADVFMLMDISFTSEQAKTINKYIFETIYHASLEASNELAIQRKQPFQILQNVLKKSRVLTYSFDRLHKSIISVFDEYPELSKELTRLFNDASLDLSQYNPIYNEMQNLSYEHAGSYSTFTNSPASKGKLQFDMWNIVPSVRYNWGLLKLSIMEHGLRNSLLVAPMPTASTSQILGNNECFEPYTSNIYSRRTLAGEFIVVNKHLMKDLIEQNIWNEEIKNNIIENKGSVQQITNLSSHLKEKYRTVWEMSMRDIIDMAADRGAYICQSQSLNLWIEEPNYKNLTSMHFHSWKKGLKTGIYYLRRKPKHQPQQFTITPKENTNEVCEMCSA